MILVRHAQQRLPHQHQQQRLHHQQQQQNFRLPCTLTLTLLRCYARTEDHLTELWCDTESLDLSGMPEMEDARRALVLHTQDLLA